MADSCQAEFSLPLGSSVFTPVGYLFTRAPAGTGLIVRRLIILIFADVAA